MIDSPDFYIKSPEEMISLFAEVPEAVLNTAKIADMCNVEIQLGKWIMPVFAVPGNLNEIEYFKQQIEEGLQFRYNEITQEIRNRVDYELSIILKKGYQTYILIVADFVNWAKNHGITVGPGRGSNAGSIISYALKISDIDPLFFKLPFYLSPRNSFLLFPVCNNYQIFEVFQQLLVCPDIQDNRLFMTLFVSQEFFL